MKTVNTIQFKIYLIVFNLMSIAVNAQDDPGLPTEGDPGSPAPIDDWILPMALVGIVMRYYFIRKKKQSLV